MPARTIEANAGCHILGAGLAGLAAAIEFGDDGVLLERESRPGGLARSVPIDVADVGRFWFDRVLHLLYFPDLKTADRIGLIAGALLAPCRPVAFVETRAGVARYPLQMHLADMPLAVRVRCLMDLAHAIARNDAAPANFEEALNQTFGRELCELFLFPYNRKVWGRPLRSLQGKIGWTVTRPDVTDVVRGALFANPGFSAYNVAGWYPRPPAGAALRGMEVLVREMAAQLSAVWTQHRVERLHPDARLIEVTTPGGPRILRYQICISTLPLPALVSRCASMPAELGKAIRRLPRNRVLSIALCIRGPAIPQSGHWRYYGQEELCFTRLVFMNEFDDLAAPPGCWGLLAECPEPAETPLLPSAKMIARVLEDARRAGVVSAQHEVLAAKAWVVDPAYVVFTDETDDVVGAASDWLRERNIHLLGRYGRWEYSSMAQVMRDGFALASRLKRSGPR